MKSRESAIAHGPIEESEARKVAADLPIKEQDEVTITGSILKERLDAAEEGSAKRDVEALVGRVLREHPGQIDGSALEKILSSAVELCERTDPKREIAGLGGYYEGPAAQKRLAALRDALSREAEHFQKVFMTSSGSTYFQASSGEILRIKEWAVSHVLQLQPLRQEIYFLADDVNEIVRKEAVSGRYLDRLLKGPWRLTSYREGAYILELNGYGQSKEVEAVIENGAVHLRVVSENGLSLGPHPGHEITKIIK